MKNILSLTFFKIHSFNTNERTNIRIESSQPMNKILILAYGRYGISYYKLTNCRGESRCSLFIPSKPDMAPKARIVAYQIEHSDRDFLHGSTEVFFNQFSQNFVSFFFKFNFELF